MTTWVQAGDECWRGQGRTWRMHGASSTSCGPATSAAPFAEGALKLFASLYDIERQAKHLVPHERLRLLQARSRPAVDLLKAWWMADLQKVPEGSATVKASGYNLKLSAAPTRFCTVRSVCPRPWTRRTRPACSSSTRGIWPNRSLSRNGCGSGVLLWLMSSLNASRNSWAEASGRMTDAAVHTCSAFQYSSNKLDTCETTGPTTNASQSKKFDLALRMKCSSHKFLPPVTAITRSTLNSLLCIRRFNRSKSKSATAKRFGDAAAGGKRIEETNFDIRMRTQAIDQRFQTIRIQVVKEEAHAEDAATGGFA